MGDTPLCLLISTALQASGKTLSCKLRDPSRVTSPRSRMELCLIPELLGWVEPGRASGLTGVWKSKEAARSLCSKICHPISSLFCCLRWPHSRKQCGISPSALMSPRSKGQKDSTPHFSLLPGSPSLLVQLTEWTQA